MEPTVDTALSSRVLPGIARRWRRTMTQLAVVFLALGAGSAAAQDGDERDAPSQDASTETAVLHPHRALRDRYLWATFGPPGLIGDALSSGFQQWRNLPREWEQTPSGYAKRFGAEFAQSAVEDTTKYLVARVFDEDPSFRPCECVGTLRRLRHAVLAPFRARKFDSGETVFSLARVAGIAAGNVAATAWYPAPQRAEGVATHVAVDVAAKIGVDVLREFVMHRRAPGSRGGAVSESRPSLAFPTHDGVTRLGGRPWTPDLGVRSQVADSPRD